MPPRGALAPPKDAGSAIRNSIRRRPQGVTVESGAKDATSVSVEGAGVLSQMLNQVVAAGNSNTLTARQLAMRIQRMQRAVWKAGYQPHPDRIRVWYDLVVFARRFGTTDVKILGEFAAEGMSLASTLDQMKATGDIQLKQTSAILNSPNLSATPHDNWADKATVSHDPTASTRWRDRLFALLTSELNHYPAVITYLQTPALSRDDVALALSWLDTGRLGHHDTSGWTSVQALCAALSPDEPTPYWEVERCLSARRAELVVMALRRHLGQQVVDLSALQRAPGYDNRWWAADLTADEHLVDVKNSRYDNKERQTWQFVQKFKKLSGAEVLYDGVRSKKVLLREYDAIGTPGSVYYLGSTTRTQLSALALLEKGRVAVEVWKADPSGTSLPNWCFALPDIAYARHRELAGLWHSLREARDAPLPDLPPVAVATVATSVDTPSRALHGRDVEDSFSWLDADDFDEYDGTMEFPASPSVLSERALFLSFGLPLLPDGDEGLEETVEGLARAVARQGRSPAVLLLGMLTAFLSELQGRKTFTGIDESVLFYPSSRMPLWVYDPTESVRGFYKTLRTLLVRADHALRDVVALRLVGPQQLHGLNASGECFTLVVNCGKCSQYPLIHGEAPACPHGDGKLKCPECGWCPHQPKPSRA